MNKRVAVIFYKAIIMLSYRNTIRQFGGLSKT